MLGEYYGQMAPTFRFNCDFADMPEETHRNNALDAVKDVYRYVMFLDSDEVITRQDFNTIVDRIETGKPFSVLVTRIQYYLSPDSVQYPQPPYCPSIVLDTTEVNYRDKRNVTGLPGCKGVYEIIPIDLHHLYYLNRKWKLQQFEARGILGDGKNGTEDAGLLYKPTVQIVVPDDVKAIQKLLED